jgi:DNA-binding transcriptional LysR family regulator
VHVSDGEGDKLAVWRGIEEFLAVTASGSFTAAAEKLGVSKSFVSKTITDLEDRFGVQLIMRTTRRLSLTAAGELFRDRCLALRADLVDIESMMGEFQSRPMGRLRIALSDTFGSDFMSSLLADFSRQHPGISVQVIAYLREADLADDSFDVVIRYGTLPNSYLRAKLFGYLSYCLCASPKFVEEFGWPSSPDDIRRFNCLSDFSGKFHFNDSVSVQAAGNWQSNSGVALRWAARRGLGLAHLPISVVRQDLNDGSLLYLNEDWTYHDKEVRVVFPAGIIPSATRAFIDYLTNRYNTQMIIRPWMSSGLNPGNSNPAVD